MGNVTYFFGAGASANSLPTYSNFKNRFDEFQEFLLEGKKGKQFQNEDLTISNELYDSVKSVLNQLKYHNTPDTIAKKYFHIGDKEKLSNLKKILILFFIYEQIEIRNFLIEDVKSGKKTPIDLRYDSLIAALLEPIKGLKLRQDCNILTWNYDLQFELAFENYAESKDINACQNKIQSFPKINRNDDIQFKEDEFSIIHLNGIAYGESVINNSKWLWGSFSSTTDILFQHLFDVYKSLKKEKPQNGGVRLLTFAWENIDENKNLHSTSILHNVQLMCHKTEYLIINGYSFPIFNRVIDKQLFAWMNNLREIHIQSPQHDQIKAVLLNELLKGRSFADTNFFNVGYYNSFHVQF
jgi:hypothetical protein